MKRNDIIKNSGYWTTKIQIQLYEEARKFMANTGWNQSQLAKYLGVSRGYVSQLLNGDYDHRLSKLVELSLSFGLIPSVHFEPIETVLAKESIAVESGTWQEERLQSQQLLTNLSIGSANYSLTSEEKTAA